MKSKKKTKSQSTHRAAAKSVAPPRARGSSKSPQKQTRRSETFTAMETGAPDQDRMPGTDNPMGAQGGLGPLNQEGEGERQNDQLAELEQIEPDLEQK